MQINMVVNPHSCRIQTGLSTLMKGSEVYPVQGYTVAFVALQVVVVCSPYPTFMIARIILTGHEA